jgi:hypothetical protein
MQLLVSLSLVGGFVIIVPIGDSYLGVSDDYL